MSESTIKNPKGGLVLKVDNFDELKEYFFIITRSFNLKEISDFEFNEFLSERIKEEPNFDLYYMIYMFSNYNNFSSNNRIFSFKIQEKP